MDTKEEKLLKQEFGETIAPLLSLRSQTEVDTGGWLGARALWACLTSDELFLVAAGKRPFLEKVPLQDCTATHYNPATGEIVIAPAGSLLCNQLAFQPAQAMELLKAMGIAESQWAAKTDLPAMDERKSTVPPKASKFAKFKARNP